MLDCIWNAAHLTHIYIARILSQPLHVHAVSLSVHTIIFSTAQDMSTREKHIYISTSRVILYGKGSAFDLETEALFLNAQEFIVKSRRFA